MSLQARFQLSLAGFELDVDLDLPAKGVISVFGPSAAGKSTLLRCVAGLQRADKSFLKFAGRVYHDETRGVFLLPHQRAFGYVFQEPRLFPHLDVKQNLQYGYKRTPAIERSVGWDEVIELLDLQSLLARRVQGLSVGEQQRVAIGRTLLTSPRLLLMDEPLASLDVQRKLEILPFIQRLRQQLAIPIFYVSHSLQEVLQITDTLVLIKEGRVTATGPMTELCSRLDVAHHLGGMAGSVIDVRVLAHENEYGLSRLSCGDSELLVPQVSQAIGEMLRIHILARNVSLALTPPQDSSVLNILKSRVVEIESPRADRHDVEVKLDIGAPLLANISRKSLMRLALQPGHEVYALIKAVSLVQNL